MTKRWTCYPGDEHFARYAIGAYGHDTWVCALEYLKYKRTFLDVGAHIGHFSWNALTEFDRVIAIEPVPRNFSCLKENVERRLKKMKYKPDVNLLRAMAGDRVLDQADVWFSDPSGGKNSGAWELSMDSGQAKMKVDVISVDSLGLTELDLMKIDTQGWESRVLDGAKETIARCKPVLIVEVVQNENINGSLIDQARAFGYGARAIIQKNMILVPENR